TSNDPSRGPAWAKAGVSAGGFVPSSSVYRSGGAVQKTFPWRFDPGRVCEFAGACKKSAQLRARCCRDRARERPTQLSLACVHERLVDCVGAKGFALGARTVNIS